MKKFIIIASLPDSILNFRGHLIKAIQSCGYQVHIICPFMEDYLLKKLQDKDLIVHQINLERTGLNPLNDLVALWSIYKVIKNVRPLFCLSYTIKPVIYGALAAKLAGVKNIVSLITGLGYAFTGKASGKRKVIQKILLFLYRIALRNNKVIFFQNDDDKNLLISLGLVSSNSNVKVVNGSGIDVINFSPANFPTQISFLLIARLLGDKGVREYAMAAKKLKYSHPEVICRLAGWIDINPNAIIKSELDEWINGGYIDFLGKLDDVKPAISNCSAYILPSYREGTPRTVLEAMAMGRGIITTDAPGCRETVRDGENGYLVPVQDSNALYEKMVQLIESPELLISMGRESRKISEEKYDVEKVNYYMLTAMGVVNNV